MRKKMVFWAAALALLTAVWGCRQDKKASGQKPTAMARTAATTSSTGGLPILLPTIVRNDSSWTLGDEATAKTWERVLELENSRWNNDGTERFKLSERDSLLVDSLLNGHGPQSETGACSWYCGGQLDTVYATSCLPNTAKHTYGADNLHDFWLLTPWAVAGDKAIGQRITFEFAPRGPRLNTIRIWNGYVRTLRQWEANSRVRELRLLIDGRPKAFLAVADVAQEQRFVIDPVRSNDSLRPLRLQLEITKVYAGKKSKDVVISEINFDGLDVHCFGGSTRVLMADQSTKPFSAVREGDTVMTYDWARQRLVSTRVGRVVAVSHDHLRQVEFDHGEPLVLTADHPLYVQGMGWCALDSVRANTLYRQETAVKTLAVGDRLLRPATGQSTTVTKVSTLSMPRLTYTLELEHGNCFVVNGCLAKTEQLRNS